jgi:hypothetical protein
MHEEMKLAASLPVQGEGTGLARVNNAFQHLRRARAGYFRERISGVRIVSRVPMSASLDRRARIGGRNLQIAAQSPIEAHVRIQAATEASPEESVTVGERRSTRWSDR